MKSKGNTILDVIDIHRSSGKPRWTDESVLKFREAAITFYETWHAPPSPDGKLRLSVDLRPFRGTRSLATSAAVATRDDVDRWDSSTGGGHELEWVRRTVMGPLLYADQYLDIDPLSFEKEMGGHNTWRVLDAIWQLDDIRPLVEAGLVVLAPMVSLDEGGFDREEDQGYAEYLATHHGREHVNEAGPLRAMERMYLRSALRSAQLGGATLVPKFGFEWRYLSFLIHQAAPAGGEPSRVAAALMSVDLPLFAGIPAETLVKMHSEEDSFVEWRRALREAARTIRVECTERGFDREARAVYMDLLVPRAKAVAEATSRSRVLKSLALDQPLSVALGATFGLGAGLVTGQSPVDAAGTALIGAVASSLTAIALGTASRPKLTGADAIISLAQGAKRSRLRRLRR